MGIPDYETCTLEELIDVERHIDKEKYPERYEEVLRHIRRRKIGIKPRAVLSTCPLCGNELEKAMLPPRKWEEVTGLLLLFVPLLELLSFLFGIDEEGLVCRSCKQEFRNSDVQT